jgi:hypothetical protein
MSQLKATERPGLQNHYQDTSLILNRSDIGTGLKNDLDCIWHKIIIINTMAEVRAAVVAWMALWLTRQPLTNGRWLFLFFNIFIFCAWPVISELDATTGFLDLAIIYF